MSRRAQVWTYASFLFALLVVYGFSRRPEDTGDRPLEPLVSPAKVVAQSDELDRLVSPAKVVAQSDELDRQLAASHGRGWARCRLARDVIDGKLTLLQGAECFRDLSAADPAFDWEGFRQLYAGRSDDERHCRHVLAFVRAELRDEPARALIVCSHLEATLQNALAQDALRLRR